MDLILDGVGSRYTQIVRAIKQGVAAGRFVNGMKLPPSRDLAELLGVSRATVVRAYDLLRAEGYLEGLVGSGSYISTRLSWAPTPRAGKAAPPNSQFAVRAREACDLQNLPGRRDQMARFPFLYNVPLVSDALQSTWARCVTKVLPYVRPEYPDVQGLLALRKALSSHIALTRGVVTHPDDLLIVNGMQQAISLTSMVLLDPGDRVYIEEPHYFALRQTLVSLGADVSPIQVDSEGIDPDYFPQPANLICVTPSHQFPTGAVLSRRRRQAVLDYAFAHDSWVLEDDYEGEFRSESDALPSLFSMDQRGVTIYVGTFSKTLFPALRLAFLVMPPALRGDYLNAKWCMDFGSPVLNQAALANFIATGGYARHLRVVTRRLTERRHAMKEALAEHCAGLVTVRSAVTGMHVTVQVNDLSRDDEKAVLVAARALGLGLYSSRLYYSVSTGPAEFIMGFSVLTPRQIRQAIPMFASVLKTVLKAKAS